MTEQSSRKETLENLESRPHRTPVLPATEAFSNVQVDQEEVSKSFSKFVERKTQATAAAPIDWDKRKDDWLQQLEGLYARMESSLRPFEKIFIKRKKMQLTEHGFGTYEVEGLMLMIGCDTIEVTPVGAAAIIGAHARVDLLGPRKRLMIVLLDKGGPRFVMRTKSEGFSEQSSHPMVRGNVEQDGWYIATTPPNITVVPFSEESFQNAIMEVSN